MERLSDKQIAEALLGLSGWRPIDMNGHAGISKTYETGGFLRGLGFVTRVAVLAEKADHHPDVVLTYPRVTIQVTTHDAGGVTRKDLELASAIEQLAD